MDHHQDTSTNSKCSRSEWSLDENQAFKFALAVNLGEYNCWEKISAAVPGRTVEELKNHFEVLRAGVNTIESGFQPFSKYDGSFKKSKRADQAIPDEKNEKSKEKSSNKEGSSRSHKKRGRREPWTPEEHKLFLDGVKKCGSGDWSAISREFVLSRTPAQVNSHAQKYFVQKRTGFRDITSNDYEMIVNNNEQYVTKRDNANSRADNDGNGAMEIGTLIPKRPRSNRNIRASRIGWGSSLSTSYGKRYEEIVGTCAPLDVQKTGTRGSDSSDSWMNKFGASAYDFYDPNHFMDLKDVVLFFSKSDYID